MLLVVFLVMRRTASGSDTVSVLALFGYTGFRIMPSANRIMMNVGYMREAHPWVRTMDADMRELRVPPRTPFVHDPPLLRRRSSCEDVSFGYDGGPPPHSTMSRSPSPRAIGRHCRRDRRRQEHAGGCAARLLPPTTGQVLIDGEPLAGRERAWQRQIGYVSQDVYLLDDSLRRNIAFGIPDGGIDEDRLAAAVSLARLDEVVAAFREDWKR